MTLDAPADRGSAGGVSGPDEKKRKKSRITFSDFFSSPMTDCVRGVRFKAANLAAD
jgi:hypothetical protein